MSDGEADCAPDAGARVRCEMKRRRDLAELVLGPDAARWVASLSPSGVGTLHGDDVHDFRLVTHGGGRYDARIVVPPDGDASVATRLVEPETAFTPVAL